ncbi:response regulator transcription factor [Nostoc ellipsosporum NOK]|nr:response regulator transcription factor [Nostoc ellipsosporum NOK]
MAIRVFVVDDHYMVVEGLRTMLGDAEGIEWLGQAMNVESCRAFLSRQQPDIILMDIQLPDGNGIDLCREVKGKYPGVFVIALTTFNQYGFIQKMMETGASGYLLKNASKDELLEAFRVVMKGKQYLSREAGRLLQKQEDDGGPVLTRREIQVLQLIAEGMTNQEIADKIFVSLNTAITHRKNLLAKFQAKNTATLIRMAAQQGKI